MNENILLPGTVCQLLDKVTLSDAEICTIKRVEEDEEIPGISYYYLVANNESLNTNYEEGVGNYWQVVESASIYLTPIAQPSN